MRDLPFVHRVQAPADPDGSVMVLLHGTGGTETDLMALAARLNPRATRLGVRGRSTDEGITRWFRRFDAVTYDQADIAAEAQAFVAFVADAMVSYGLQADRLVFLGYSNGANLLGAVMRLHPGVVTRAILLRGIEVLEGAPAADLAGTRALILSGARDPYARMAPALIASLRMGGAEVEARTLDAGHELTPGDVTAARAWLTSGPTA